MTRGARDLPTSCRQPFSKCRNASAASWPARSMPTAMLLGFVFGLTGVERGKIVHWSDMLAVRPEARNLGLGRKLKEHQRQLVRELGASVIYWTYDPLIARNAHLNFNRLGVRLAEYVEDMYGITDSVLHGGIPTDRLVVAWPTRDEEIDQLLAEAERAHASGDCQQAPMVTPDWIVGAGGRGDPAAHVRVEIPADARDASFSRSAGRSRGLAQACALRAAVGGRGRLHRQRFLPRRERGSRLLPSDQVRRPTSAVARQ